MTEPPQGDSSNQGVPGSPPNPPAGSPPPSQGSAPQGSSPQQGSSPYGAAPAGGSDAPQPPVGGSGGPGGPGVPQQYPGPGAGDPNKPGSKAWVQQRHGRTAEFGERILPGLIDSAINAAAAFIPVILGIVLIIAGLPDTYDCGYYNTRSCEVPGSGSGGLIALGVILVLLSFLIALAVAFWNRVWQVTKTGQSIGKKVAGLKVIDAESGAHPELGPAVLRELVHQFAGIISWIWMLVDDDDRTLADIVGKTHVIHTDQS